MIILYPIRLLIRLITAGIIALLLPVCIYAQTVVTYPNAGLGQTFTVPAGVTSIKVKAWGAAGGAYTPMTNIGGGGGFASATLNVFPGEVLTINVGGGGTTAGGINGGGASPSGAGGGGMTDIKRGSMYLVIAGGGGGAGNGTGGSGGGTTGGAATVCSVSTQGGSQSGGGLPQGPGTAGSLYQGGTGPQGGGGGGYYGGGGGGVGCGGGGGSGYASGACTSLQTAPTGNYPFVGGTPADTANAYYNGTAGKGNFGTAGNPGLLVIIYGEPVVSAPTITGDTVPCIGVATTYTTEPGRFNYIWNVNGGTIVSGGGPIHYSVTVKWNTTPGSITVSYTECGTPTTTSGKTITAGSSGGSSVSIAATPGTAICTGATATFTATAVNGGSAPAYQWKKNGNNVATGAVYTATGINNNDTITAVLTSNSACTSNSTAVSNAIIMQVSAAPEAGTIAPTGDTVCTGDSRQLSVTGNSIAVQWQSSLTGTGYTDISNATGATYTAAPTQNTYYRVRAGSGGCTDSSGAVLLVVGARPPVPLVSAGTTVICPGDSTQLCATGAGSFLWSNGDRGNCAFATDAGDYQVTITGSNGCTAVSDNMVVSVHPVQSIGLIVKEDTLSSFDALNCQWYFNDVLIPGATGNIYVATQSGKYSLRANDSNGCSSYKSVDFVMTGIEDATGAGSVEIYPNPTGGQLWIVTGARTHFTHVKMINTIGQEVLYAAANTDEATRMKLDLSGLPQGLYRVLFYDANQFIFSRVVVLAGGE